MLCVITPKALAFTATFAPSRNIVHDDVMMAVMLKMMMIATKGYSLTEILSSLQ